MSAKCRGSGRRAVGAGGTAGQGKCQHAAAAAGADTVLLIDMDFSQGTN